MGYWGIPIKISSILIFGMALGISVDNTIHYLSRYRQQRKLHGLDEKSAIIMAIKETGQSMISSACVLVCGFLIFVFSSFGATLIVGYLVPFTLLVALLTNLVLLPCMMTPIRDRKSKVKNVKTIEKNN
jgi:predicted RND superfamily exporter protein